MPVPLSRPFRADAMRRARPAAVLPLLLLAACAGVPPLPAVADPAAPTPPVAAAPAFAGFQGFRDPGVGPWAAPPPSPGGGHAGHH